METHNKFKKIIFILFLLLLLLPMLSFGQEINTLNSAISEEYQSKIYEIVQIYEDYTVNTLYIKTFNVTNFELSLFNSDRFNIWEYSATLNGEQKKFIPRPMVGDPTLEIKKYHFIISEHLNSNITNLLVIKFSLDNVKGNKFLYPFDKYLVEMHNREIQKESTITSIFNYNSLNMKPYIDATNNATFDFGDHNITIEIPHKPIILYDKTITSETGSRESNLGWIGIGTYEFTEQGFKKISEPTLLKLEEFKNVKLKRRLFPSRLLFYFLIVFLSFLTIYTYYSEEFKDKSLWGKLHHIYVTSAIPLIASEFTVSILPPARPRTLTLFDLIVFLPIILILIFILIGNLNLMKNFKKYKKKINEPYYCNKCKRKHKYGAKYNEHPIYQSKHNK